MQTEVAIIDSGGANIASLLFAFERLGQRATLTADANVIRAARRVVLPGVGAARDAMARIHSLDLADTIRNLAQPVLGICLGMQLLAEASEEEDVECLGIIPGTATRLTADDGFPVPNMGWCELRVTGSHPVLRGLGGDSWCYFLHSYALPVSTATVATAMHTQAFSAAVSCGNFIAAQFHPERSSRDGTRLLRNFLAWDGR